MDKSGMGKQQLECQISALTDLPHQQLEFALPPSSALRFTDIPAPCLCREQLEQLIPDLLGAGVGGSEASGQEGPLPGMTQEYFKSLLCDFTASHFMEVGRAVFCLYVALASLGRGIFWLADCRLILAGLLVLWQAWAGLSDGSYTTDLLRAAPQSLAPYLFILVGKCLTNCIPFPCRLSSLWPLLAWPGSSSAPTCKTTCQSCRCIWQPTLSCRQP